MRLEKCAVGPKKDIDDLALLALSSRQDEGVHFDGASLSDFDQGLQLEKKPNERRRPSD